MESARRKANRVAIAKLHTFVPLAKRMSAYSRRLSFPLAILIVAAWLVCPHAEMPMSHYESTSNGPDQYDRQNVVDVIERNTYYQEYTGDVVLVQWIFWRWDTKHSSHVVVRWMIDKSDDRVLFSRDTDGLYRASSRDAVVVAKSFRETWTTYDPEIVDRNVLPNDQRPKFRKRFAVLGGNGKIDEATTKAVAEILRRRDGGGILGGGVGGGVVGGGGVNVGEAGEFGAGEVGAGGGVGAGGDVGVPWWLDLRKTPRLPGM